MSRKRNYKLKGLVIAFSIILTWLISLIILFSQDLSNIKFGITGLLVLWQTFLFTGLFITAHDAMHGSLFPNHRKWNTFIGNLAVKLYALFSFKKMRAKHYAHHNHVASKGDPDFHDGVHKNFILWYLRFLKNYISWQQIVGMAIIYNIFKYFFQVPDINLLLFWVTPAIFSTLQLFYFGTYLPHREPSLGYENEHRSKSLYIPPVFSFLTCYHFGYHLEHHKYPYLPWWQLPNAR